MGFNRGSKIGKVVWDAVKKFIPEEEKHKAALKIVCLLESMDADTLPDECPEIFATAYPWMVVSLTGEGDEVYEEAEKYCQTKEEAQKVLADLSKWSGEYKIKKTPKR